MDHSGDLSPADALASFQIYLEIIPEPTEDELCRGDCDGSEMITPEDGLCIFLHYLNDTCDCVDPIETKLDSETDGKIGRLESTETNGVMAIDTVIADGIVSLYLDVTAHEEILEAFGLRGEFA